MTLFDKVGTSYNKTRRADERICASLTTLLGVQSGAIIADIGAGSGNYSIALARRGFRVKAVEPSAVMRNQAQAHINLEWYDGYAEDIPLPDHSVDGVISTLAIHYFSDLRKAFREMVRISGDGPIVIFTVDPRLGEKIWFADYFPSIWDEVFKIFPPIEEVADLMSDSTSLNVEIIPFKLPYDLTDNFGLAGWRYPHHYLDEQYRANIISFQIADQTKILEGVKQLQTDIDSGTWKEQYGGVLKIQEIDAGYRFVRAK